MIAAEAEFSMLGDEIEAGSGIRPVADNVAQAINLLDAAALDVEQHSLERFEVRVDVGDNGKHASSNCGDRCSRVNSVGTGNYFLGGAASSMRKFGISSLTA